MPAAPPKKTKRPQADAVGVAVVHGNMIIRAGLQALVQRDARFRVVHTGSRLDELALALAQGRAAGAQVVLAELVTPVDAVCAAIRRWYRAHPRLPVVAIGMLTPLLVQRVAAAGVHGVLAMGTELEELHQSLHTVAGGGMHANEWMRALLQRGPRRLRPADAGELPHLSPREAEVLHWICHPEGHTYAAIAVRLNVGRRTVESYRDKLFKKFDVDRRSVLVLRALKTRR